MKLVNGMNPSHVVYIGSNVGADKDKYPTTIYMSNGVSWSWVEKPDYWIKRIEQALTQDESIKQRLQWDIAKLDTQRIYLANEVERLEKLVKQTEAALPISEQARTVWQKYSESPRAYLRMAEVKILEQVFNPSVKIVNPEAFEGGEG